MSIWKGWMKQEDYPNLQSTQTFKTSSLQSNLPLKKKKGGGVGGVEKNNYLSVNKHMVFQSTEA